MDTKRKRIAVLLSGGVDSSVALRLLQEDGYRNISAFYLKIWLEDELKFLGDCPWEEDLCFARQVCDEAGGIGTGFPAGTAGTDAVRRIQDAVLCPGTA